MSRLVDGSLAAPDDADRRFFDSNVLPWMGRFFGDLERAECADFYRSVGTLGRVFMEIETESFALPT
jgi:TorA maturation chaperone TorD